MGLIRALFSRILLNRSNHAGFNHDRFDGNNLGKSQIPENKPNDPKANLQFERPGKGVDTLDPNNLNTDFPKSNNVEDKSVKSDPLVPNPDGVELSQRDFEVIKETNALRVAGGRLPLIVKDQLLETANKSSHLMNERGGLKHGLTSGWLGENIALGQTSPKEVVQDWKNSPGHYENLMRENFKYIGVGEAKANGHGSFWTQQFA